MYANLLQLVASTLPGHDFLPNTLQLQVFSTLSFSGSALFSKWNRGFDVVIIDEAAQAVSRSASFFIIIIIFALGIGLSMM